MIFKKSTNSDEIKNFYRDDITVKNYLDKRFSTRGGEYVNNEELNSLVNGLRKYIQNCDLVDLGSGTGRVTLKLLEFKPRQITAVDSSRAMLETIKKIRSHKIRVVYGSAEEIPLPGIRFDGVFSLRLMEHLDEKILKKVFKEVHRILKKGGFFSFNTVNSISLDALLLKILGPSSSAVFPISNRKVEKILNDNGFQVERRLHRFLLPRGLFTHSPNICLPCIKLSEKLFDKLPVCIFSSHIVWYAVKID